MLDQMQAEEVGGMRPPSWEFLDGGSEPEDGEPWPN